MAVADTLLAPSLSAIGPHVMAPPVRETERTPVAGCASLAASRGAPASSPTKPTPTLASPLGRRTRLTDTTCCATSVAAVGALIHVACAVDVTCAHAVGYARPTNVAAPSGSPVSGKVDV